VSEMTSNEPGGWRVLGFGKHPENAAAVQERLRASGLRARNFALTNDRAGDDQLVRELDDDTYDAVLIGGYINGQDPETPATPETTAWFNRILNIIHAHAPEAKIVLVAGAADALPAVGRILGEPGAG
jgi:hypothetical protein